MRIFSLQFFVFRLIHTLKEDFDQHDSVIPYSSERMSMELFVN